MLGFLAPGQYPTAELLLTGQTFSFFLKTAKNRHFIETLLLEYDIRIPEKLFN
jgi:hypothetical protein